MVWWIHDGSRPLVSRDLISRAFWSHPSPWQCHPGCPGHRFGAKDYGSFNKPFLIATTWGLSRPRRFFAHLSYAKPITGLFRFVYWRCKCSGGCRRSLNLIRGDQYNLKLPSRRPVNRWSLLKYRKRTGNISPVPLQAGSLPWSIQWYEPGLSSGSRFRRKRWIYPGINSSSLSSETSSFQEYIPNCRQ